VTVLVLALFVGARTVLFGFGQIATVVGHGHARSAAPAGGSAPAGRWPRWLRFTGTVIALVLALGLLGLSAAIHSGTASPDAFYNAPGHVPSKPGVLLRSEPLKAMVIGAFVRGLSMRDVESLCEQAGLGKLSKSTASRICSELRERFEAFGRRDLYDIHLAALFLDAVFLSVRRDGPKEGVLVAWGFTDEGERVLLAVMLGMRESHEDWLALGRDLIARGLGAPMLIVADGAPGLTKAIEQCWPASDRQRCCVHRARNLYAKLPEREREPIKQAYWRALDDAISPSDAKQRLQALVDDLDQGGYTAAAKCLADDLDALVVHLRYPPRHRRRWRSTNLLERSLGEVKRRTKVMGRFPGEESCLTLVWAVLDLLITHQTNGIHFNQLDRQRLKRMSYEGTEPTIPEEVTAA